MSSRVWWARRGVEGAGGRGGRGAVIISEGGGRGMANTICTKVCRKFLKGSGCMAELGGVFSNSLLKFCCGSRPRTILPI